MGEPVFKRILLKLSGEALMGDLAYGTDPEVVHALDLTGDGAHHVGIGAVGELAHERLPGELEEDPREDGVAHRR